MKRFFKWVALITLVVFLLPMAALLEVNQRLPA